LGKVDNVKVQVTALDEFIIRDLRKKIWSKLKEIRSKCKAGGPMKIIIRKFFANKDCTKQTVNTTEPRRFMIPIDTERQKCF